MIDQVVNVPPGEVTVLSLSDEDFQTANVGATLIPAVCGTAANVRTLSGNASDV